jgi:midasin (ATPase involved in ribosome maturation)
LEEKDINHIIKCFNGSKEYTKGNEGNTFRELLKIQKLTEKFSGIEIDYLLELILSSNIQSSEINKFKNGYLINSSINLKEMEQKNNDENIYFQKMKNNINKIENKFTFSQKEAINKIILGIINDFPTLLIGDIGAGKTFIIEELARIFDVNLKVIQFTSETNSFDLIGRLELNKNKIDELKKDLEDLQNYLIEKQYLKITKLILLIQSFNIEKIINLLKEEEEIIKNYEYDNDKYNKLKENLQNYCKGIKGINFGFNL